MTKKRQQCPIRLHEDVYERVKAKTVLDKVTFQKLIEIVLRAYLKDNKEIMRLVKKYSDEKYLRKTRHNAFTELEEEELLRRLEEASPLSDVLGAEDTDNA